MSADPDALREQELRQLAQALRAQLVFHAQCGISTYPFVPPAPKQAGPSASAAPPARPAAPRPAVNTLQHRASVRPAPAAPPAALPQADAEALAQAQAAMRNCQSCPLSSSARFCGQGKAGAIFMVVGDFARLPEAQTEVASCFGQAEDALLWRMLDAISLKPEQVYVTNVLKCVLRPPYQPTPAALQTCRRHLLAEIAAIGPRLICVMGEQAARILLRTSDPMTRLRTRQHYLKTEGPALTGIPIMVTWHPRLLLDAPDLKRLKRSAWTDLQAMQAAARVSDFKRS